MNDTVFAFLGSKTMDHSRQFDNHQMGLIKNLYDKKIIKFKNVIMSVYVPDIMDYNRDNYVKLKTEKMKEIANQYCFNLDIIYVKGKTPGSLFLTLKQIREKISAYANIIIFAQNYYSGYIGLRLKQSIGNVYLHTNLRGLPAEEELVYSDSPLLKRLLIYLVLKIIGKKVVPESDSLSVVSKQYKKYLESRFETGLKPIIVYPCVYNSDQFYKDESLREIFRKKYHIQDHQKVFVYSGSMNNYQVPVEIFQFYSNIAKQDPGQNCVFLFLTLDREKAVHLSKSYPVHNLIVKSVYDKDLLGIYNASDIGVICRNKDIVNHVASPTKIGEYLSTGNSVILTEGIGDYSEDLRDKEFAIVKKDISDFLKTSLNELMSVRRLDGNDLAWVKLNYSNEKIKIFDEIFKTMNSL